VQASWFGEFNGIFVVSISICNIFPASIAFIFQPIGSVMSGIILEPLGRKRSMILVNIPHIVAWLMFHYASSLRDMYISAVLLGLGVGILLIDYP
jgi:hypothetical protein